MADNNELSEREIEILQLVATGASNKEIAQKLYISANTVKVHLRNIFTKIGAASRTEAAMYAVQQGLVHPAGDDILLESAQAGEAQIPVGVRQPRWLVVGSWAVLAVIFLAAVLGGLAWLDQTPSATLEAPTAGLPTPAPRWQERAAMGTARASLAVAAYNNQVYVIGGETTDGVTGLVERYDPENDAWQRVTEKPLAVADAHAVVVGGKIYVPGGRTVSGAPTDALEIYDPVLDTWSRGASLPAQLSAYAMVAYEGRLYLFGGWDGEQYLDSVYRYDPLGDRWERLTSMPTARAYAGAAVAEQRIYLIGGWQGDHARVENEIYAPPREAAGENPWSTGAPLPEGRYRMGVTSVVDIVYVIGGEGDQSTLTPALEYQPAQDRWDEFEQPAALPWSRMGLVLLGQKLYLLGGELEGQLSAQNLAYQAIYTIAIPSIVK